MHRYDGDVYWHYPVLLPHIITNLVSVSDGGSVRQDRRSSFEIIDACPFLVSFSIDLQHIKYRRAFGSIKAQVYAVPEGYFRAQFHDAHVSEELGRPGDLELIKLVLREFVNHPAAPRTHTFDFRG